MSPECGSCGGNRHWRIVGKLGACPSCMRLSALGTLVGWTVVVIVAVAAPASALALFSLFAAASFTLLLGAHVALFVARSARGRREGERDSVGEAIADRRRFMAATAAALAGVLLAPLTRQWWSPAVAKESPADDPCAGKCTFKAEVEYHAKPGAAAGTVTISSFRLQITNKADGKGCNSDVGFAPGALLEFKVTGENACKIETIRQFLDSPKNCGTTIKGLDTLEKKGAFESITLKGVETINCEPSGKDCKTDAVPKDGECAGETNTDKLNFNFEFKDGKVTHDGTEKKGEGKDQGKNTITWEKTLPCKATCKKSE